MSLTGTHSTSAGKCLIVGLTMTKYVKYDVYASRKILGTIENIHHTFHDLLEAEEFIRLNFRLWSDYRLVRATEETLRSSKGKVEFIVRLEDGVWLADGDGDPPRTLVRDNARVFDSVFEASWAIGMARAMRPFHDAEVMMK